MSVGAWILGYVTAICIESGTQWFRKRVQAPPMGENETANKKESLPAHPIFNIWDFTLNIAILVNALALVFSVWSHLAHLGHTLFVISNVISQYLYQRLMYLVTQITLF